MLLLVDDDPEFLIKAQEVLRPSFRNILFALGAEHARALMRVVGREFSMVMIDLSLATDNGFDLISEFHQRFPTLPVIAVSGVYTPDVLDSAKVFGAAAVLAKPVTPEWMATVDRLRSNAAHS